ncbi:heme-binding domain-containing protein [Chitinophaga caseinilytica]|uniref:Heme-binding domain-containing protein n=1 Tax=Chitinophaga caseinilytica TaxID=2267521 RepID=A0ABZ2YZD1_9BACT
MRILKLSLIGVLVAFLIIQFFKPAPNKANPPFPDDFTNVYEVPPKIHAILQAACYDCHSNNTRYPWYARVQPVTWFLDHHVREGKDDLNFHEYGTYSAKRRRTKLKRIREQLETGGMPLRSYIWMHDSADLSPGDRQMMIRWLNEKIDSANARK